MDSSIHTDIFIVLIVFYSFFIIFASKFVLILSKNF